MALDANDSHTGIRQYCKLQTCKLPQRTSRSMASDSGPRILDWRKITDENLVFEEPRQNAHHGLTVGIKWRDPVTGSLHPILHQTPLMRIPFGITDKKGEYGRKIEVNLSFSNGGYHASATEDNETVHHWDDSDEGREMQDYFKWVSSWDERNVAAAIKNTTKWFRKPISPVVITELYKNNVKLSSDPSKYSPTFRTKIPTTKDVDESPISEFFGAKKEIIAMNQVIQGSKVIALMKVTGLWFAGKSFGMNFTLVQLVQMGSEKFKGCAISIPTPMALANEPRGCLVDDDPTHHKRQHAMDVKVEDKRQKCTDGLATTFAPATLVAA